MTNFKMILEGEIKDLKLDECYLSPICNITSIQIAVISLSRYLSIQYMYMHM